VTNDATACPVPATAESTVSSHIMAIVQLRNDTEGRAYYRRKLAAGKTTMEAMRCLKRRLSDVVYRQMVNDAKRLAAGPGGHTGATTESSATDFNPTIGSSDKSLPEPTTADPTPVAAIQPIRPSSPHSRRPRSTPGRSRGQAQSA
jgi:hypothetical protein